MTDTIPDLPPQLRATDGSVDLRGVLTFAWPLPEPYQSTEDSTQEADFYARPRSRARYATETEKALLRALGYVLPEDAEDATARDRLVTRVEYMTPAVRRRTWPALADQSPTAPTESHL